MEAAPVHMVWTGAFRSWRCGIPPATCDNACGKGGFPREQPLGSTVSDGAAGSWRMAHVRKTTHSRKTWSARRWSWSGRSGGS